MTEERANFLMDTGEKRRFKEVFDKIEGLNCKVTQLRTGDFLMSGEKGVVLVERKSLKDFTGSISSKQLWKELEQMSEETSEYFDRPLLEALSELEHQQWAEWAEFMLGNLTPTKMNDWSFKAKLQYHELEDQDQESDRVFARKVLQIIFKISWRRLILIEGSFEELLYGRKLNYTLKQVFSGMVSIPISWNTCLVWLENKKITESFLLSIADYLGKPREPPAIYGSRPKRKMKSLDDQQQFFLEGLAGVGGETADKWLRNAGSLREFFRDFEINHCIGYPAMGDVRRKHLTDLLDHKYKERKT